MKLLWICIYCILLPLGLFAQKQTEYNRKGDEAMARKDYSDAKIWYEEGVSYCDSYSVNQLTRIWLLNERMRPSMRSLMNKCLNCLNVKGTEQDTTAMHQLVLYYKEGIGTPTSEELADYWTDKLEKARRIAAQVSEEEYTAGESRQKEKMYYFVGYQYSIEAPLGLTFGGVKNKLGWYVRFRTNMSFENHSAECNSQNDGTLLGSNSEDIYYFTGRKKKNSYAMTTGMLFKFNDWLYTSVGLGYGERSLLYEYRLVDKLTAADQNSAWAKHLDASCSGVAADLDFIVRFGSLYVSAGCNTINFKYADLNAGIGMFF